MRDFIISAFVTMFTNVCIIVPFWDKLKVFWLKEGYTAEQISKSYYILCGASYLCVGLVAYIIIKIIKWLVQKSVDID